MPELPLEMLEGSWPHLKKHNLRQSLFIVSGVSLLSVAEAVSQDQKQWIAELIQNGKMRRPSPEEVLQWESAPKGKPRIFSFIIVQPFVFMEIPIEDH